MGSWAETCGISQLSIEYKDPVRVYILTRSHTHRDGGGGYCYPDEVWVPFGLPIKAQYDDYGSIEKVEKTYASDFLLKNIINSIDHTSTDKYHHVNLKKKNLSWTEIITAISQEEINLKSNSLGIMFVLEDIFQTLISMNPISTKRDNIGYLYQTFDSIIDDDIVPFFKNLEVSAERRNKINDQKKNGKEVDFELLKQEFSSILDLDNSSIINDYMSSSKSGLSKYKEELISLIMNGENLDSSNVKTLFSNIKEHILFTSGLSCLRKSWIPQCGKGSQDFNIDEHLRLSAAITKFCNKKNAAIIADGGEAGSEYELNDWQKKHNEEELRKRSLLAFV